MVGREFQGKGPAAKEVKKKTPTGREDVHPQNRSNRLILNWCIGGCWFTPAASDAILNRQKASRGGGEKKKQVSTKGMAHMDN